MRNSVLYNTTTSRNRSRSNSRDRSVDSARSGKSAASNDRSSNASTELSDRTVSESVADIPLQGRFNQRLMQGKSFSEASLYKKNITESFFITNLKESTLYQLYKIFGPNEDLINAMKYYEYHILESLKTIWKTFLLSLWLIQCIVLLVALNNAQDENDIFYVTLIIFWVLSIGLAVSLPDMIKKYFKRGPLTIIKYKDYFYGDIISLQSLLLVSDFVIILLIGDDSKRAINLLVIILLLIVGSVMSYNFEYIDWALVMYHLTQARLFIYIFVWVTKYHFAGLAVLATFVNDCAEYLTGGKIEIEKSSFLLHTFPLTILISCIIKLKFIFKPIMSTFFFYGGLLELSGPEVGACVMNSLLGPIAGLVLVHSFLPLMTNSELHLVLTSGFSSYSGELFLNTITNEVIQTHRMLSSIISFPLSIAMSKLIHPETKYQLTTYENQKNIVDKKGNNIFAILVRGANIGIEIFVNGGSVVFTLSVLSHFVRLITANIHDSVLCIMKDRAKALFAFFITPLMYVVGIHWQDVLICSYIYSLKLLHSEKEAFQALHMFMKNTGGRDPCIPDKFCVWGTSTPLFEQGFVDPDSKIIVTYLLSGFSAFERFAYFVAAVVVLIPERMSNISNLIGTAFFAGFCANLMGSLIIGLWLG